MANENEQSTTVKVNRGKLGSISLFEITEDELDTLERGSPSSTYLNFAIGLLSLGISTFGSIFLTDIQNLKVYVVFWVVALVATIGGIILLVVWHQASKDTQTAIKKIRNRLSPAETAIPSMQKVEEEKRG